MAFEGSLRSSETIDFLHLGFNPLTLDSAVDAIAARASLGTPFTYVVTPNVDHMVKLAKEPARRPLYEAAWLTLNDSKILSALAKKAGVTLPVASGSDIAKDLFENVIDRHEPIVIIGGDDETVAALKRRYTLTNVRWRRVPMGLKSKPEAIVKAAQYAAEQGARFTFICVGAPQQEMVAYAIAQRGDATGVGICCGAGLQFLAGTAKRAPKWMRAAGLEWLHRLVSEPGRMWKRYLVDGPKVFSLFAAWRAAMAS